MAGTSPLDEIRANRRKAIQNVKDARLDLTFPSTGGKLVIRYRAPEWEEAGTLVLRAITSGGDREGLYAGVDLMVRCCEGAFLRGDDDELVPLNEAVEDFGDEPVRFDQRFCSAVGVEWVDARTTVLLAADNDFAVGAQSDKLANWIGSFAQEEQADF